MVYCLLLPLILYQLQVNGQIKFKLLIHTHKQLLYIISRHLNSRSLVIYFFDQILLTNATIFNRLI